MLARHSTDSAAPAAGFSVLPRPRLSARRMFCGTSCYEAAAPGRAPGEPLPVRAPASEVRNGPCQLSCHLVSARPAAATAGARIGHRGAGGTHGDRHPDAGPALMICPFLPRDASPAGELAADQPSGNGRSHSPQPAKGFWANAAATPQTRCHDRHAITDGCIPRCLSAPLLLARQPAGPAT